MPEGDVDPDADADQTDWKLEGELERDQPAMMDRLAGNMSPGHSGSTTGIDTPIEADSPSYLTNLSDGSSSVPESVYEFPKENGRTYHGYRAGTYHFPNDPSETDRLDFQYQILKYAFSDRSYFAPLDDPQYILDVGTGTGQWAIDMGDEFPDAEIEATDLSPIQPDSVPENVHFFIDDASEEDWALPPNHFDYIHTRVLLGCFVDFRDIIRRAYYYTRPGGYMESQEIMSTPYCDDGTMPENWPFREWTKYGDDAAMEADRPMRIANKLKRWYNEVGFVDVQEKVFKLPMNTWPKNKHMKALGRMSEDNWLAGLSGFSMGHFSRILNWSKDEIEVYLINVRKSISDRRVHAYHKIYVVWGRKPEAHELEAKAQAQAQVAAAVAAASPSAMEAEPTLATPSGEASPQTSKPTAKPPKAPKPAVLMSIKPPIGPKPLLSPKPTVPPKPPVVAKPVAGPKPPIGPKPGSTLKSGLETPPAKEPEPSKEPELTKASEPSEAPETSVEEPGSAMDIDSPPPLSRASTATPNQPQRQWTLNAQGLWERQ